jgi:hypothetical protein
MLGNVNVDADVVKIEALDWANLTSTTHNMVNLKLIFLFCLPDKLNYYIPKLVYNSELLNQFEDTLDSIQRVVNEHYENLEPKRIALHNLLANQQIWPHTDFMYHFEHTRRIHIPVITNEQVVFSLYDGDMIMKKGEVVEFNNNVSHSVINGSDLDRVHFVIDYGLVGDTYYGPDDSNWKNYL